MINKLKYKTGDFSKTLLDSVKHYVAGQPSSTVKNYTFQYYSKTNYFSGPYIIDVPNANLKSGTLFGKATAIGNNKTWGKGAELASGAGFGGSQNKKNSINLSYSYDESWNKNLSILMDINGDGLPDKVVRRNTDDISYYPLEIDPNNINHVRFLPYYSYEIPSLNGLGNDRSQTNGLGLDVHAGITQALSVNVAGEYSETKSITNSYFVDANGDGLVDFAKDGNIYYNKLNDNGIPQFIPFLSNVIILGGCDTVYIENGVDTTMFKDIITPKIYKPTDVVRMWIAPYSNRQGIWICNDISYNGNDNDSQEKWIKYSIEYNGSTLLMDSISTHDVSMMKDSVYIPVISKGDKVFFRLFDNDNIDTNKLQWRCKAYYSSYDIPRIDADSKHVFMFTSDDDYTVTNKSLLEMPFKGIVKIEGTLTAPPLSDTVRFQIVKNGVIIKEKVFLDNNAINYYIDTTMLVDSSDIFSYYLKSNTQVEWSAVDNSFKMTYLSINTMPPIQVDTSSIMSTLIYRPYIEYSLYANDMQPSVHYYTTVQGDILFRISFTDASAAGNLVISIKNKHKSIKEIKYNVNGGNMDVYIPLGFTTDSLQDLYFDVYTDNIELAKKISSAYVWDGNPTANSYYAGVHTIYPDSMWIFGNLNRNWGQFTYTHDADVYDPINESLLYIANTSLNTFTFDALSDPGIISGLSSNPETWYNQIDSLLNAHNITNPMDEVFGYMYLDMADKKWKGVKAKGIVDKRTMSTEKWVQNIDTDWSDVEPDNDNNEYEDETLKSEDMEEFIYSPFPVIVPGHRISAIIKISETDNWSFSASVGPNRENQDTSNFDIGFNITKSKQKMQGEFMDMNGDGYPDVISDTRIQYTTPYGDFEKYGRNIGNILITENKSRSLGANAGTNFSFNEYTTNGKGYKVRVKGSVGSSSIWGDNIRTVAYQDINGDGLPDHIYVDDDDVYKVRLNKGYCFENNGFVLNNLGMPWANNSFYQNESGAGSVEFEAWESSISLGISFTYSEDGEKYFMTDVNGDGLADKLIVDGSNHKLYVNINTGNGFLANEPMGTFNNYSFVNRSSTQGGNGAVTFAIPAFICKFIINPSGNKRKSSSAVRGQLMDINNDGYADLVFSTSEDKMIVYYSNLGKVNLLANITNPIEKGISIDYELTACSQEMPQRIMAMKSAEIIVSSIQPGSSMYNEFEYYGGKYNREDKTFYGFDSIKTYQYNTAYPRHIYRIITEKYHTNDFRFKGLKKYEEVADSAGNKYIATKYTYVLKDIPTGAVIDTTTIPCYGVYPALLYEDRYFYEGQPTYSIHTKKEYNHTSYGNISLFKDYGDVNDPNDDVTVNIEYLWSQDLINKHILTCAKEVVIHSLAGGNDIVVRRRGAEYDNNGRMTAIHVLNDNGTSTTNFKYDNYGNITYAEFPADINNEHKSITINYDAEVFTYPIQVSDESGYSSSAIYDYRIGKPLKTIDIAGQEMQYTYDADGRMTTVRAPNEIANNIPYTIKFSYPTHINNGWGNIWAKTKYYNPGHDDIVITTLCNVLGMQTALKRTSVIYDTITQTNKNMITLSNVVFYDAMGRINKSFYPQVKDYDTTFMILTNIDTTHLAPPTITYYDVLDRKVKITTPDQRNTYMSYGFGTDKFDQLRFMTEITDPNGIKSSIYKDARNLQTTIKDALGGQTGFKYDAIGQLLESSDPENFITRYTYDMIGQLIEREHPDAGTTRYTYDNAGNMIAMQTQNLIDNGDTEIDYIYHLGRLMEIHYPENPEMNVYYKYGAPGTGNQSGRLIKQQDATGVQTFKYGNMGEMIRNTRTIMLPKGENYTFEMNWQYDSWNRISSILYPDGENVKYNYNQGGDLENITSSKPGYMTTDIVSFIGYDKFGSRLRIDYGNNTRAEYTYDSLNRRLLYLKSWNSDGEIMQNIRYKYDNVDNIINIENYAQTLADGMGGLYSYGYKYDELYRLINSEGIWQGEMGITQYKLGMSYTPSGRIINKYENANTFINGSMNNLNREYNYIYDSYQPHAVRKVNDNSTIKYDANGNMVMYENETAGVSARRQAWDEENRIGAVGDRRYLSTYVYDAGGDRVLKMAGFHNQMWINNENLINFANLNEDKVMYLGGYMVVTDKEYTKHYYIEGERICSKIGGGFLLAHADMYHPIPPIHGSNYDELSTAMLEQMMRDVNEVGYDGDHTIYPDIFKSLHIFYDKNDQEDLKYFYHPDHLGSASFVTNADGYVEQHIQYLPFGELFVSQRNSEFDSRYKFTAKELDNETSYTYFGARYYDSDLSVWLSVDPMSDKYPSTSAYMYCVGNPIRLIDVNGEYWGDPLKKMKVRRNSVKNTFGPVRRNKNGTIKNHQGIDYYAPIGTPVYAINNGIVVKIVNEKQGSDYGTYIVIQHYDENGNPIVDENGKYEYSFYAHLSETSVTVGDNVVENETVIGKTGNTGNAENLKGEDEHLHFEIRTDIDLGKGLEGRKDPNKYVDTKFVIDSNDPTKVIMIENN